MQGQVEAWIRAKEKRGRGLLSPLLQHRVPDTTLMLPMEVMATTKTRWAGKERKRRRIPINISSRAFLVRFLLLAVFFCLSSILVDVLCVLRPLPLEFVLSLVPAVCSHALVARAYIVFLFDLGKHSLKKDDYLTNIMLVPPKQRMRISRFDQRTQEDAFAVSSEGLKGVCGFFFVIPRHAPMLSLDLTLSLVSSSSSATLIPL